MWMNAGKMMEVVNKIASTLRVHIIANVIEDIPCTVIKDLVQVNLIFKFRPFFYKPQRKKSKFSHQIYRS